jgi:hypothetical protein
MNKHLLRLQRYLNPINKVAHNKEFGCCEIGGVDIFSLYTFYLQ